MGNLFGIPITPTEKKIYSHYRVMYFCYIFFLLRGSVGDFSSEPVRFPLGIFVPNKNWREDDFSKHPPAGAVQ